MDKTRISATDPSLNRYFLLADNFFYHCFAVLHLTSKQQLR